MSELVSVTHEDGVAVVTLDNPPVNALSFRLREPLVRRSGGAARRPGRDGHRGRLRRAHLHLRRRHHRVRHRQGAGAAQPAGPVCIAGEDAEAGGRRHPRHRLRRRAGAGARLPFPRRRRERQARPAGGEARPVAGLGRHGAPAAPGRTGKGAGHDRVGQSGRRRRRTRDRPRRRDRQERPGGGRRRLRPRQGRTRAARSSRCATAPPGSKTIAATSRRSTGRRPRPRARRAGWRRRIIA